MKRILSTLISVSILVSSVAQAASIGRSSSSSSSRPSSTSSSVSRPAPSPAPAKSAPAPAAPAPAAPGGIGGNSASVGVRNSAVTNGVKNDIAAGGSSKAGSVGTTSTPSPTYTPTPSYGYATPPQPVMNNTGMGIGSVFLGALGGTIVGNALFGNHGHGSGTTVINNGGSTPSTGMAATAPSVVNGDSQFNPGGLSVLPKKEYTVWNFIADVFGFVIVVALLVGVAWLLYRGFQMIRNFVNKERGVSNQPFNPTQQFWEIQRAFAAADLAKLQMFLGPDVVDELTNNLQPSTVSLHNVSHEVRLNNRTEFSVWYKFEDAGEHINQVWHYQKFGKDWKLNGIENV